MPLLFDHVPVLCDSWGFVALLVMLGVITATVTSPIMIYWFSAYFNDGKPCYTKEQTASAGCKMSLSKLAVFSGWFSSTSGAHCDQL